MISGAGLRPCTSGRQMRRAESVEQPATDDRFAPGPARHDFVDREVPARILHADSRERTGSVAGRSGPLLPGYHTT